MPKLKTFITAKIPVVGYHQWPAAPEELQFLSDRHRHTFHIRVSLWVCHDDRAVEFTQLRKEIIEIMMSTFGIHNDGWNFETYSCEQLSKILYQQLKKKYSVRSISFSEDEEFYGGIQVTW